MYNIQYTLNVSAVYFVVHENGNKFDKNLYLASMCAKIGTWEPTIKYNRLYKICIPIIYMAGT